MVHLPPTIRERAPFILRPEHWNELRTTKRKLIKLGFTDQFSYWADFQNEVTGAWMYVRAEIMIRGKINHNQVYWIKQFLTDFPPLKEFSIWTYDAITSTIDFIGAWNR
jgi:hypothetical protein